MSDAGDEVTDLSAWRSDRGPGWTSDIGYALTDVLNAHRYEVHLGGSKPDDPGWHPCTCGWEGYWSVFHNHVGDHLRQVALTHPQPRGEQMRATDTKGAAVPQVAQDACDDPEPQHWCSYPTGPVAVGTSFRCEVCGRQSEAVPNMFKTHPLHPDVAWRSREASADDAGRNR